MLRDEIWKIPWNEKEYEVNISQIQSSDPKKISLCLLYFLNQGIVIEQFNEYFKLLSRYDVDFFCTEANKCFLKKKQNTKAKKKQLNSYCKYTKKIYIFFLRKLLLISHNFNRDISTKKTWKRWAFLSCKKNKGRLSFFIL